MSECVLKTLACRGLRVGPSKAWSWDPDCLVQGPNSWISPKNRQGKEQVVFLGEGQRDPEMSLPRATPRLHRCKPGVALEQETFLEFSGLPPKRLLAPSLIDFWGNPGIRALYQAIGIPRVEAKCRRVKLAPHPGTLKSIAIHLPFLSRCFCKSMPSSW